MAKKKSKKKEKEPWFDDLSPHAKQAIAAVLVAVLGIFFAFSLFNFGGLVGDYTKAALNFLFGGGAYLAPVACGFFVYALLNPKEDESVSTSKVIGISILFLSLLGFLSLWDQNFGGWVGVIVEYPLDYLVGNALSYVLLGAFTLISLFLIFNMGLSLPRRKEAEEVVDEDADALFAGMSDETDDEEEPETEEDADEAEDEVPEKKSRTNIFNPLAGKKSVGGPVITIDEGPYKPPPLSLLNKDKGKAKSGDAKANANIIKRTLAEFGINVEMDTVEIGPTVTRYALKPAQGVKISRIVGLQRELELNLASGTIRIEAPIPGKSLVGIEVPNTSKAQVGLASLLGAPDYTDSNQPLLIALGKDITGKAHFSNIARMPHGLIAGTTGSGKSVMIHNLVVSLLYRNSPEQLRFIMVDPKRVELTLYDGIPHLLAPVITTAKKALMSLKWAVKEMERRYDILQSEKVQNLASYHEKIYRPAKEAWIEGGESDEEKQNLPEPLPYIVVVMDELADLMHAYPRELEALIVRLAQMSRAVGIHLILATQRPSVNVITGTIKANIPTRLAMQVASQIDSRTILDQVGAEKLLGQGDMLYLTGELSKPIRLQSAFISEEELKRIINYLKDLEGVHELDTIDLEGKSEGPGDNSIFGADVEDDEEDDLYEEAKQTVIEANKASTSFLQRKLRVGYSRAARLMDILEERGVIGPGEGAKPREILVGNDDGPSSSDEGDDNLT